jgi:hypothetical protein
MVNLSTRTTVSRTELLTFMFRDCVKSWKRILSRLR